MGVMNCSRYGCDEIMCRTYIDDIGYLCYDCRIEFQRYMERKYTDGKTTKENMKIELKAFMKTKRREEGADEEIDVRSFITQHTPE